MAKITVCDRCGRWSPDKKGLFIANHWVKITTKKDYGTFTGEKKITLCTELCWPIVEAALQKVAEPDPGYSDLGQATV